MLIWPINLIAQVNIEQYRNNTGSLSKKYFQHVNISTSVKRSTSNLYSIGLKYFKPFALPHSKGFLLTKVNYGESNGKEYVNNTFYHLRVISSTLVMNVIPEAFIQFENNHYALTKERYLAELGLDTNMQTRSMEQALLMNGTKKLVALVDIINGVYHNM